MNKYLTILFTALCAYACSPKSLKIEGTVQTEKLNGSKIYIKERINRVWTVLDSTIIKDRKFTFDNMADSAKIAYIVYEYPAENTVKQAFIFENGKLIADIDSSGLFVLTGTPQNNLLQKYREEKYAFSKDAESIYKQKIDSNTSLQQKQVYAAEIANLNIVEINIDKKFVRNNINTLVGTYIFTSSFYNWNLAEKDSIVTLFNDQTKNITRVKEIIADINIEKQLSVGSNFKDFKLANLKGDSISLSNLVGNTDFVLVDYWASWCGSCIQSLPELKVLYAKYKGSRLEILGVSLDDNKKSWSNAIVSHQLSWKHISDLKGWKCAGSRAYAVNSIPCTILIDKKGKIIGRNLQISEIENLIKAKVAKN